MFSKGKAMSSIVKNPITDSNIFIELNKINDELIREKGDEIRSLLKTKMYNFNYLYTLAKYKEIFTRRVVENILESPANIVSNLDKSIEQYLIYKINREYKPSIKEQCDAIAAIPTAEQKSPEWYRQREELISASDAGYFLKIGGGASRALDTLKIKLGLKMFISNTCNALTHGNAYEDVTRAIYETRHGVGVTEYGLLNSRVNCIGASPDGIVTDIKLATFDAISRYGRLLEIKNPYSRTIDETIKPEYMVQILQQQYTTILPVCDFVETTIVDLHCNTRGMEYKPYLTIDEMLADCLDLTNPNHVKRIRNPNIPPSNLNKFGNEKGVVVCFSKKFTENDIRNKYISYPLTDKYEKLAIEKWIVDLTGEMFKDGWEKTGTRLWRLDVYSEKTVIYDEVLYERNYVPRLKEVWNVVTKCREMQKLGQNVSDYVEDLPNQKDSPFYNESQMSKRKKVVKKVECKNDEDDDVIYDM